MASEGAFLNTPLNNFGYKLVRERDIAANQNPGCQHSINREF